MLNNFWVTIAVTMGVTTLLVVMLSKWKSFCNNFWKIVYTTLGVFAFLCLFNLGNFAIHKVLEPRKVTITSSALSEKEKTTTKCANFSGQNTPQELVSLDSYKATYDLFDSHFSHLLSFLAFFGALFGIFIPVGAFLLQRQSIKEEREKIQKEIDKITNAEQQIKKINEIQKDQFITEKTNFYGLLSLASTLINDTDDEKRKVHYLHIILVTFDNAINCATKAEDSEGLFHLFNNSLIVIEKYCISKATLFQNTIEEMKNGNIIKNDPRFVSGEEILKVLGNHNRALFERYKKIYEQIYPWKFNGQQKRGLTYERQ